MDETVQVKGLNELLSAFGRIDKSLRREVQGELKKVAGVVAIDAKRIAEEKGLKDTGKLIRSIRPGVRRSYAYITDSALKRSSKYPQGFNYPAVYEYGHGGSRSFLAPAAQQNQETVVRGLEEMLDRLLSGHGF